LGADLITSQDSKSHLVDPLETLLREASDNGAPLAGHLRELALVKALIHDNDYQGAINIFKSKVIENSIIGFQREKVRNLLVKYAEAHFGFSNKFDFNPKAIEVRKKVESLVNNLTPQYL
jgi:hypothetical protein